MPDNLNQIAKEIVVCQRCELRQNATCPVPGFGSVGAKYFLIGEAPGQQEDENRDRQITMPYGDIVRFGIPFVGQAGRRLDKLLGLAGIDINLCYLANVIRCRPPSNRDPKKKEIRACVGFLWREIRLVKPQYLITLGSLPLSLFCPYGIRQMHGTMFEFELNEDTTPAISLPAVKKPKGQKESYGTLLSRLFSSDI